MHSVLFNFIKIAAIIISIFASIYSQAQSKVEKDTISPVIVTNHSENNCSLLMVKWLTDQLIYPRGVNIYQQEFGELGWKKLNKVPIIKGMYSPTNMEYSSDSTLKNYIEMAKSLKPSDLKGFVKAYILIKSVQSNAFARFIGIQYNDTTVEIGVTYRYKITALNSTSEEIIGYSNFIKVDKYLPEKSPTGIEIKPQDKRVHINWVPEDLRFHGVNIYRSSSKDTVLRKLNGVPLMISKRKLPNGEEKYPEIFFTDDSLENRVRYTYKISGIDFFGRETELSEKITVMPGDKTPPLAPFSLKVKVDKYNIKLSWINKPNEDQEGIAIYRSFKHDKQYARVNQILLPTTDTLYLDNDLQPGFYYYSIAAVDSAGNEGWSAKMLAQVHDITPPSTPKNLTAVADTGKIVLKWDRNSENDLLGYQIYRTVNTNKDNYFVLLNSDPFINNTFTDTLPINAKNYFLYKVVAVDSALNRSGYTEAVKAKMPDITPPVQPVIIGVIPKGDYMQVEWMPNRELDLLGYNLYRGTDSIKNHVKINSLLISPTVTKFTDRNISADTLYYYSLQAIDSAKNCSKISQPYAGVTPTSAASTDLSEINKFTAKKIILSKGTKLQWTVTKSSSFIGYTIFRRQSVNDEPLRLSDMLMENKLIDTDKNPPTVQYQLRVYHSTGQVVKSEWISK